MKCLFILRDALTHKALTINVDGAQTNAWESKAEAKKARDKINAKDHSIGAYVSYGPDHRLYGREGSHSWSTTPQRRRRNLKKRSHRTQANMGKPQPAKRAEKARRLAEKRSNSK